MAKQNYYEILGVDKNADLDAIKKAYRKLVRKYHPDVSKDPGAVQKTAEVNEAYETLKDSQKRAEYDEMLANPFGAGQGNPFGGAHQGNPFEGAYGDGSGFRHYEFHSGAGGEPFGQGDFHFEDLFSAFGRRGQQQSQTRQTGPIKGEDQHAELSIDISAAYQGAERSLSLNMPTIDEHGRIIQQTKTLNVKIPKGIAEGQQIRLSGQGLPGINGGTSGDLYLKIRFHEQPDLYVKNKKDVCQTIDIFPWQAALGGKTVVSTIGGKLQINLPANSQSGKSIRLKGKGIPAKDAGDLYLNIRIVVPSVENEADRAAWEQLSAHFTAKQE
ncbi:DnaJ C-terminal domain-containing protein [Aggregatibacter actinomycetemcomitans]|uniref:DnaJ C-terminal domain-containing protein n=1 Tax=Aggregatibacter actinomycetemcomitans TaxID=714 RepID=UPI000240041E|nr:DnaJ C-terminal domain-containing protein [Aggregatibacter actinomycetemcomitans]EHK90280.1 curved DNA-binding protein [Aggregatibacter actinomycetemcomitans RhAA1]KNE77346.1 DNA-binding protein [Aggregatibacter actinomycetemcomitans RhAA1]